MATEFDEAAKAAGARKIHAEHVCTDACPVAACVIHGKASENCDERCLEATQPELFER